MRWIFLWALCVPSFLFAQKSASLYIQILEAAITCEDLADFLPRNKDESICLTSIYIHNKMPIHSSDMLMEGIITLRDEPWSAESLDHCAMGVGDFRINKQKSKLLLTTGTGKQLRFKLEKAGNTWHLKQLRIKQKHPSIPGKTKVDVIYYKV